MNCIKAMNCITALNAPGDFFDRLHFPSQKSLGSKTRAAP